MNKLKKLLAVVLVCCMLIPIAVSAFSEGEATATEQTESRKEDKKEESGSGEKEETKPDDKEESKPEAKPEAEQEESDEPDDSEESGSEAGEDESSEEGSEETGEDEGSEEGSEETGEDEGSEEGTEDEETEEPEESEEPEETEVIEPESTPVPDVELCDGTFGLSRYVKKIHGKYNATSGELQLEITFEIPEHALLETDDGVYKAKYQMEFDTDLLGMKEWVEDVEKKASVSGGRIVVDEKKATAVFEQSFINRCVWQGAEGTLKIRGIADTSTADENGDVKIRINEKEFIYNAASEDDLTEEEPTEGTGEEEPAGEGGEPQEGGDGESGTPEDPEELPEIGGDDETEPGEEPGDEQPGEGEEEPGDEEPGEEEEPVEHDPDKDYVIVKIEWDDADNQDGLRPEAVRVDILANGEKVGELDVSGDTWRAESEDLEKGTEEEPIEYTVENETVGYSATITKTGEHEWTITQFHEPAVQSIPVTIKWIDDGDHPEQVYIAMHIKPDGEEEKIKRYAMSARQAVEGDPDTWTYTFRKLPMYTAGKLINYTLGEYKPENYEIRMTKEDNGYVFTNHTTKFVSTTRVRIIWNDASNKLKRRPKSLKVGLYQQLPGNAKAEKVLDIKLSQANAMEKYPDVWEWLIDNTRFPRVDADGNTIIYSVRCKEPKNYSTTINDPQFSFGTMTVDVNEKLTNTTAGGGGSSVVISGGGSTSDIEDATATDDIEDAETDKPAVYPAVPSVEVFESTAMMPQAGCSLYVGEGNADTGTDIGTILTRK